MTPAATLLNDAGSPATASSPPGSGRRPAGPSSTAADTSSFLGLGLLETARYALRSKNEKKNMGLKTIADKCIVRLAGLNADK